MARVLCETFMFIVVGTVQAHRPGNSFGGLTAGIDPVDLCKQIEGTFKEMKGDVCTCYGNFADSCNFPADIRFEVPFDELSRRAAANLLPKECYCQGSLQYLKRQRKEVQVSAVRFCQKLAEYEIDNEKHLVKSTQRKLDTAKARCQQALTHGYNFDDHWEQQSPGEVEITGGRLARAGLHWHLQQVCKDECEALVKGMQRAMVVVYDNMKYDQEPAEKACAEIIVQHVEANLLGCCGRSCGWDGKSCQLWPLLDEKSQQSWQQECCGEDTVLKGSQREQMCDSVLSRPQKQKADEGDTTPVREDKDDGQYVGQDTDAALAFGSLMQVSELQKLTCGDDEYLAKCPNDIKKVKAAACQELRMWKVVDADESLQLERSAVEESFTCVQTAGPAKCRQKQDTGDGKGSKPFLFQWTWDDAAENRIQECCSLEPSESYEDPEYLEYSNTMILKDFMTRHSLFLPRKPPKK